MFRAIRQPFAWTSLANRALIPILRSRAGPRLGRRLAVVEYHGRRSGRHRELVTQYTVDGRIIRITVGVAARKTWWRNFNSPQRMRLRLAGDDCVATGHVEREGDSITVVAELDALPHDSSPGGNRTWEWL